MPQVDIITDQGRHRRWTDEEKLSVLAAAFAPGAVAAHVAKRANISSGQLYTWRKQLMKTSLATGNGFAQVVAVTDVAPAPLSPSASISTAASSAMRASAMDLPAIELEVRGNNVRIPATIPAALASAVVRALVQRS
jgi:transposase